MRKALTFLICGLLSVFSTGLCHAQFHWPIPHPMSVDEPSDTLSICIIGDVMMHSKQLGYPDQTFLEKVCDPLKKASLSVANMEFPLAGAPYSGYPVFSTPDSYAKTIADCGVDVFLVANNHVLDKGSEGLKRTLGIYESMQDSIFFTGCGADRHDFEARNPLVINKRGLKIAFINFTHVMNGCSSSEWPAVMRMSKDKIGEAIKRAKDAESDFIIVLPHWGEEYELLHDNRQQEWAEWLCSQGVDAIVGSHPHVLQDTTHIGKVPVIYSLGNAISNMSARNTRLGAMATIRIVKGPEGAKMLEPQIRFIWCTLPGTLTSSYASIFVDEWEGRRNEWIQPSDYDNMIQTRNRVLKEALYEKDSKTRSN